MLCFVFYTNFTPISFNFRPLNIYNGTPAILFFQRADQQPVKNSTHTASVWKLYRSLTTKNLIRPADLFFQSATPFIDFNHALCAVRNLQWFNCSMVYTIHSYYNTLYIIYMIPSIILNTTQLTNVELHNIKRDDLVNFTRAMIFTFISFMEKVTPDGMFEFSRVGRDLRNMTSIYDLESTICSFISTKNYTEFFSILYRAFVPMGSPVELNTIFSYGVIEEYISGYRCPYNTMSSRKLLNNNKRYLYVNGMGTDINVHKNNITFIEKIFNITCDGIYNPTHSVLLDGITMVTQYLSATSRSLLYFFSSR